MLRVVRLQLEVVLAPAAPRTPQAALVADHDSRGAVEAVLEVVTNHSEVGESHPARLDCAGARHPVTLALLSHLRRHVLQHTTNDPSVYDSSTK